MTFTLGDFFPRKVVNEPFLALNDPRWTELEGGYKGSLYDASVALKQLELADTLRTIRPIYEELWNELHHQGDVSIASYYAVPHLVRIAEQRQLVDFNVLSLVSTIEIQRHKNNPKLPPALQPAYQSALNSLEVLANIALKQSPGLELLTCALAAIAISHNQTKLADVVINLDSNIIDEFLETYG
jgi:hypothetical protein